LALDLFGYERKELTSLSYPDLAHPDQSFEPVAEVIQEIMKFGVQAEILELKMRSKTGETIYIKVGGTLIPGKNEIIGVAQDITKQKMAEAALRKSETKYRSILETIEDGYYEVDNAGNFIFFNDALCRILGYNRAELLGINYREYTDDEHARKLYQIFNKVFITGVPEKEFGWEIERKNGTKGFVEVSVSLKKDAEGRAIGFRGIARDMTKQRKLEAEFQRAQKMESIGTLAGGIAHNFNNVLMGIQGRASLMMLDKEPSHPDLEHLKEIETYVKSAVELTKDLLGFARGGKYEVRPTDLNALIKQESRMFGSTKKEIRIYEKYQKELWTTEVDQGQIQQVLLNLYVNAWQAMPGGGDLYIQTENLTLDDQYIEPFKVAPGKYIKISITDTGEGMDEAIREKVFDPFFTTKEPSQGSGLGLASVYGIIKNHGGFINVYSEKGKGTSFNIYLPASDNYVVAEHHGSDKHIIEHGQETILLVDDEGMIIDVGKSMLEKLGYRVLTARNGVEALDIYRKQGKEIDLVIIDMIMPDMGGGETYDHLKKTDQDVKVLLSSGYSLNGQAKDIINKGCLGFIQKPFTLRELSTKMREVLED
jgi:PAS domain S-box-containing protein